MTSPRLIHLPYELKFKIAGFILADETDANLNDEDFKVEKCSEKEDDIDKSNDSAATTEITDDKESLLSYDSSNIPSEPHPLFNLSQTCTSLYRDLSPYLFQRITLRNTERSGKAVDYLCQTNQVANVTVLHFKAEAPGEYRANFRDVVGVFPPKVNHVLSNLSQFPNLRTLIVDFDFHIHNGPDGMDYHWDFLLYASSGVNDETVEEVEEAERQEGWRALVKKTLLAVSSQGTDSVQAFVFKIYPINTNSVFGSAVLNKWLSKLESFKFEAYGCDVAAGHSTTTDERFLRYINRLNTSFLNALENVTRLSIIGHKEAPLGKVESWNTLVPLQATHVPKLKELELGYYFIQDDFLDFLVAHSATLEHINFHHCYYSNHLTFNGFFFPPSNPETGTWNSFFHAYAATAPHALHRITFDPHNAALEPYGQKYHNLDIDLQGMLEAARGDEWGFRAFPYATVNDRTGYLFVHGGYNAYRAWKEWDLEGWRALVGVMEGNRGRGRGGREGRGPN